MLNQSTLTPLISLNQSTLTPLIFDFKSKYSDPFD